MTDIGSQTLGAYGKRAEGRAVVAAGSPAAAEAGRSVLAAGGNAVDAAVATALAMGVVDPANTGLLGHCHLLIAWPDGKVACLNGATRQPANARAKPSDPVADALAVPGNPFAYDEAVTRYGRLTLAEVCAPAIKLASDGFLLQPQAARLFELKAGWMADDPGAILHFGGGAWRAGQEVALPSLADTLWAYAVGGAEVFRDGPVGRAIIASARARSACIDEGDLMVTETRVGEMVRVPFRDAEVITVGSQAWGHTLAQMLMMTSAEVVAGPALTPVSAERRALTIRAALDDRPVDLVTHAPKLFGLPLELLLDPIFVATRADQIDQLLFTGWAAPTGMSPGHPLTGRGGGGETTHLSVIDQEGVMVALTTTLGPHFGVGICCPETGLLFAQSKMTLPAPNPGAPDVAEVCPVILGRNGKPFACIGAAGGTRTPGAVLQVITNVIDGGMDIAAAIAAPRVNWWQHELRVHASAGEAVINRLRRAAPGLQIVADEVEYHLGVVQGAMIGTDGQAIGAADPGYDGVALAL